MSRLVIGIDPGLSGAIAFDDGDEAGAIMMPYLDGEPNLDAISGMFSVHRPDLVVFEEPFANPSTNGNGALKQGLQAGMILGLVYARGFRVMRVRPADWKKKMGVTLGKGATDKQKKERSIRMAKDLYPAVDLIPSGYRTEKDGMAEALLLCQYGRRTFSGDFEQRRVA